MMLSSLILLLLAGGVLAWWAESRGSVWPRWIALGTLSFELLLVVILWMRSDTHMALSSAQGVWLMRVALDWIPRFGISFHLGMDGLSLLMILLTLFLGMMAVSASWTEIRQRTGFFYFNLLWTLAGVVGVFLALDLFLFFVFWEVMLVPMYFVISIFGHDKRIRAGIKFFMFTQGSGLLMLVAILALVLGNYYDSGELTFDYFDLLHTSIAPPAALWIMLGFFVAFAVKLPIVPFHPWLPDAHTEAPTGGSVILAGVLLKTGAYGMLRFLMPLFPESASSLTPLAMALGVLAILYGGVMAFAQSDLKRLVAYSSISHMGFVLLGIFAWNALALAGAVMQMIAHGITTGALFMLAGSLQERLHTREMARMGGLWASVPRLAAFGLLFAVATLGLPGLGNFVGEFLILLGAYRVHHGLAMLAVVGIIIAAAYALILVQRAFHGEPRADVKLVDYSSRETAVMAVMALIIAWLGLYPQLVLTTAEPALDALRISAQGHMISGLGQP